MTVLFRKLIKNPGIRVPGRLSHSPSSTLPPFLGFSFLMCKNTGHLTIIHSRNPSLLTERGNSYSELWMIDQKPDVKKNTSLLVFSQTDRYNEGRNPAGPPGFAWGPNMGNSYTSRDGSELDFYKRRVQQPSRPLYPLSRRRRMAAGY